MVQNGPLGLVEKNYFIELGPGCPRTVNFTLLVETLLSSPLSDFDINYEEFAKIIDEKVKYEEIKENIKNVKHENLERK